MLYVAAALLVGIGLAHSYLGERYLLIRLFRRDNLPKLFGGDDFTKRTLRFAWHVTSVAWFGFAAILVSLQSGRVSASTIAMIIGVTFLIHFLVSFFGGRGKHLSWPVFLLVGLLAVVGV